MKRTHDNLIERAVICRHLSSVCVCFFLMLVGTAATKAESGLNSYGFLTTEVSAYASAQGGNNVLLRNDGSNVVFENPSLIGDSTDREASITYHRHLSETGVQAGIATYGWKVKNEHFAAGVKFLNYGKFDGYDELGNDIGSFSAQDVVLSVGWAKQMTDAMSVGVAIKPAFSHYERYNSFAIMFDAGVAYAIPKWNLDVGMALQNVGVQVVTYKQERERLPLNLSVTAGKEFEHAPFRLWMTWFALNDWNFDYVSNGENVWMGNNETSRSKGFELLLEHSLWGADFILLNDMLRLSVSYNVRRAEELKLADGEKSLAGFSFGGGIDVKKVKVDIATAQYQSGVWNWTFTLRTNLNYWKKEK